jgi:biotin synthase
MMFSQSLIQIAENIINDTKNAFSYEEACAFILHPYETVDLILCSNKIRNKYKNNHVFTCSIINAKSGFCSEDCAFCAQSAYHNTEIATYPLLSINELVDHAIRMHKAGATKYSMVTSGYTLSNHEIENICRAASLIKSKTALSVCASLGVLSERTLRRLRESGVTTYHHNLETARSYFDQICTTHTYDEDIETIQMAQSAGLRVCSGGILGLGETWEQRVELAITLRDLNVDSIPINFLNPIPGTRMENRPLLNPMEALKCIALVRVINPEKDITICGGREVNLRDYQSWIFIAGTNGLMVGNYLTTQGRNISMDIDLIREMNLMISEE